MTVVSTLSEKTGALGTEALARAEYHTALPA